MFYTLWSAKCKSIVGKALSATCKVHVIYRHLLDLWFVIFCNKIWVQNVFYVLVFYVLSSSFLSSLLSFMRCLLLFYPPCFKCSSSTMHHACDFFVRWEYEHGLRYELWTLCIDIQGHCNLASKLMLQNLQHNTIHLLPILVFKLLSFKVCMSNLYSSATGTTNGCLEAEPFCVLFAHYWWLMGNSKSWTNWKA